jgi:hypothetical protein
MRAFIKRITNVFFNNKNVRPLGRWKIENCDNKLNRKIDMSNEDHCGPCGQYIITKIEPENKEILNNSIIR